jgi:WD40 repeat protein
MYRIIRLICVFWGLSLSLLAQSPQVVLDKGHKAKISQLQFATKQAQLYSASSYPDKSVKCWDLNSGKLLHNFNGSFDSPVFEFSPDEKELVVFSFNDMNNLMEFKVWDVQTRKLKFQQQKNYYLGNPYFYRAPYYSTGDSIYRVDNPQFAQAFSYQKVKISPNNKLLAVYTSDAKNEIKLLDFKTLQTIKTLKIEGKEPEVFDFSADGQKLICGQEDFLISIWDLKTYQPINKISGAQNLKWGVLLSEIAWSSDQKTALLFGRYTEQAILIDLSQQKYWEMPAKPFAFLPDLSKIATINSDSRQKDLIWKIWDTKTQKIIEQQTENSAPCTAFTFGDKNLRAFGTEIGTLHLLNSSGKTQQKLGSPISGIRRVMSLSEDKLLIINDLYIKLWDKKSGKVESILYNTANADNFAIAEVHYSAPTRKLFTLEYNQTNGEDTTRARHRVQCIHLDNNTLQWTYPSRKSLLFCLSGDQLSGIISEDGNIQVVDLQTFKPQKTFKGQLSENIDDYDMSSTILNSIRVSPDNNTLVFLGNTVFSPMISAMDLNTQKFQYNFTNNPSLIFSVAFNITQNVLVIGGGPNVVGMNPAPLVALDLKKGTLIQEFFGHQNEVNEVAFHPSQSDIFVTASADNTLKIWNIKQEKPLATLNGHMAGVTTLHFTDNGKYLVSGSEDGAVIFWDWVKQEILLSIFLLDELGNYVIISPEGRFDGTPEGIEKLIHFTVEKEVIEIDQLKERYYEPNLWKKALAYTDEPLRQVPNLDKIELYPEITTAKFDEQKNILDFQLKIREGGLGKIALFINGKEAWEDIKPILVLPLAKTGLVTGRAQIGAHPLLRPNAENQIELKVYNQGNWLVSRPYKINFKTPTVSVRGAETPLNLQNKPADYNEPAQFYALCIGVSEYKNPQINLKLSAKDAEDMANALEIGAKRLFEIETKGLTKIYRLSSKQIDLNKKPTRKNILQTFAEIEKKVRHQDVVVIYLAGHGVNYGGQDGDFYFLTADALSMKLDDPAIRNEGAISSKEITEFFKKMKAQKQVLIMDACHSGKAIDNLMAKRDIEGTTIRALDKMKDRTGLHIISGCTADAVSYEASQFDQGLLTYAILSGMRGKALKDNQLVDINLLFQHAREEVPDLARGIGGIQEPKIFSPYGGETFYLGLLTEDDKLKIKLPTSKPILLPSDFIEETNLLDILDLQGLIDEALRETANKNNSSIVFVNTKVMPDAYKISGIYKLDGENIRLKGVISRNEQKKAKIIQTFEITHEKNDLEGFCQKILRELKKIMNN